MSGGMWHRTLVYLGLKEEPEEGYDELPERFVPEDDPHAEHAAQRPAPLREESSVANVRAIHGEHNVRSIAGSPVARAAVIQIRRFEDVEEIGSRYRTGQPVLFDLSTGSADTSRRVVDFVSGLTYASRGNLAKVARRAFLLVPDGVELPLAERRRLADLGYELPTGSEA